jgi:hypothetical protein
MWPIELIVKLQVDAARQLVNLAKSIKWTATMMNHKSNGFVIVLIAIVAKEYRPFFMQKTNLERTSELG